MDFKRVSRLSEITAETRLALERRMRERPVESFAPALRPGPAGRLVDALRRSSHAEPVRFLAEVKKASPSRGVLREDLDPMAQARAYRDGGAAALSVLTEERYFRGSPQSLRAIAAGIPLPVLQKDFTLEDYQLYEAVELGAAAVLLIAAILPPHRLVALCETAGALGLDALVEVHDEAELEAALGCGARLVGINNRDLRTFELSLETTMRLLPRVPEGICVVGESGILERRDVVRLEEAGVDALLVGEALMRSPDPASKLRELRGVAGA